MAPSIHRGRRRGGAAPLGALLCWAVVFADLGTSVYYTPGILFGETGAHAALFVSLTLIVFVLLAMKYSEVSIRYPEGGGVVTVGAHAVNSFVGLIGGLLILVDYFLTSALSSLSGLIYLSVVAPPLRPVVVPLTVVALVLIAALNLMGISLDATVTAVIATIALLGQLAVVVAVLAHVGLHQALAAVPIAFHAGRPLTPLLVLTGYSGAFLAFSGLESISQLSPAMASPRRRVAPRALFLVVLAVMATTPLLTLWSTTLLTAHSPGANPNQFISLLGGYAAGPVLQIYVAASAALLLVFASNTATIGCYHVFLVLSRMHLLPDLLQRRNRWRDTPHWAIATATAIPIAIVMLVNGNVGLLGDMYSFGLLGAFSVTCICLDIVRWRQRRSTSGRHERHGTSLPMFLLGLLTSALVTLAWVTNLFAKPQALLFGGGVTLAGLAVVAVNLWWRRRRRQGGVIPVVHHINQLHVPASTRHRSELVVLSGDRATLTALMDAAGQTQPHEPVILTYASSVGHHAGVARLREIIDPYLDDTAAQQAFRIAHSKTRRQHRLYLHSGSRTETLQQAVERMQPHSVLIATADRDAAAALPAGSHARVQRHGVALTRVHLAEPTHDGA